MSHQPNRRAILFSGAAAASGLSFISSEKASASSATGAEANEFTYEIIRSEAEWRAMLTEEEYGFLREGKTEERQSSPLWKITNEEPLDYNCKGCGLKLYQHHFKTVNDIGFVFFYHSERDAILTGLDWPSQLGEDFNFPTAPRIEAHCRRCGSHLGHIVSLNNQVLHCINGACLTTSPA